MSDYKVTLTNPVEPDQATVEALLDNYGEQFDDELGDFIVTVSQPDVIEIVVSDVAAGDVKMLLEDIDRDFGEYDLRCDMVSELIGGNWFSVDLDEEPLA